MKKPIVKKANYYAFALNEFRYKLVGFTMHRTHEQAQRSAYRASGQRKRSFSRVGDLSAEGDLEPTVIHGLKEFEAFAAEGGYVIDWTERYLRWSKP